MCVSDWGVQDLIKIRIRVTLEYIYCMEESTVREKKLTFKQPK